MGKLVSYQECKERKWMNDNEEYLCYVTPDRLNGFCELMICEKDLHRAECFFLSFTPDGLRRHFILANKNNIQNHLNRTNYIRIRYAQAIVLLRDAADLCCRQEVQDGWLQEEDSIHLQRIRQEQYYNDQNCDMEWIMLSQDCRTILKAYFQALQNKDATLMYDLFASDVKNGMGRSLYAHHWNHVLAELKFLNGEIDPRNVTCNAENDYTLLMTLYGYNQNKKQMEVDLRLRIVEENGIYRVFQELVLEARPVCNYGYW